MDDPAWSPRSKAPGLRTPRPAATPNCPRAGLRWQQGWRRRRRCHGPARSAWPILGRTNHYLPGSAHSGRREMLRTRRPILVPNADIGSSTRHRSLLAVPCSGCDPTATRERAERHFGWNPRAGDDQMCTGSRLPRSRRSAPARLVTLLMDGGGARIGFGGPRGGPSGVSPMPRALWPCPGWVEHGCIGSWSSPGATPRMFHLSPASVAGVYGSHWWPPYG